MIKAINRNYGILGFAIRWLYHKEQNSKIPIFWDLLEIEVLGNLVLFPRNNEKYKNLKLAVFKEKGVYPKKRLKSRVLKLGYFQEPPK